MILRGEQRTDIAVQDEIRLPGALDGLLHLRVGGVDELTNLLADGLLPAREGCDVGVDARIGGKSHVDPPGPTMDDALVSMPEPETFIQQ